MLHVHWDIDDIANMMRIGAVHMASALQGCQKLLPTLRINALLGNALGVDCSSRVKSRSPRGVQQCPCAEVPPNFANGSPLLSLRLTNGSVESQCLTVQWMSIWYPYDIHWFSALLPLGSLWAPSGLPLGSLWASCQLTGSLMASGRLSVSVRMSQAACSRCSRCSCSTASGHPKSHAMQVPLWKGTGGTQGTGWKDKSCPWKMMKNGYHSSTFIDIQTITRMFCRVRLRVLQVPWGLSLGLNSASAPVAVAGLSRSWHV